MMRDAWGVGRDKTTSTIAELDQVPQACSKIGRRMSPGGFANRLLAGIQGNLCLVVFTGDDEGRYEYDASNETDH